MTFVAGLTEADGGPYQGMSLKFAFPNFRDFFEFFKQSSSGPSPHTTVVQGFIFVKTRTFNSIITIISKHKGTG